MSHLCCPLCGLNHAISSFDPSSLDLDLKIGKQSGAGRGKGWTPMEKTSVLGDDIYSPMVADRVLNLCNMFLGEKVISLETLVSRLGLSEDTINTGNFVLKKDYENSMLETVLARDKIKLLESDLQSLRFNMRMSEKKLEELEKTHLQEKHVERILGSIIQNLETDLIMDDETPWILEIKKIDYEGHMYLADLSENIDNDLRGRLSKRLKATEMGDQLVLDEVLLKKRHKITLAEKIENLQLTRAPFSELRQRLKR
jgi:hypothetical protein